MSDAKPLGAGQHASCLAAGMLQRPRQGEDLSREDLSCEDLSPGERKEPRCLQVAL